MITNTGVVKAMKRSNKRYMDIRQIRFKERNNIQEVEEGDKFSPAFDNRGLIPVVTTDFSTGQLLMHGYMNEEALKRTIATGEAHYWSRSRQGIWRKGETSGFSQIVKDMLVDDDQDCIWISVDVKGGASCHVGYRSCFYRRVSFSDPDTEGQVELSFVEGHKVFDPSVVYKDTDNPTKL